MTDKITYDVAVPLAEEMGCGVSFAYDLLVLANGDVDLVRTASSNSRGADSVKAYILNHRISAVEDKLK